MYAEQQTHKQKPDAALNIFNRVFAQFSDSYQQCHLSNFPEVLPDCKGSACFQLRFPLKDKPDRIAGNVDEAGSRSFS